MRGVGSQNQLDHIVIGMLVEFTRTAMNTPQCKGNGSAFLESLVMRYLLVLLVQEAAALQNQGGSQGGLPLKDVHMSTICYLWTELPCLRHTEVSLGAKLMARLIPHLLTLQGLIVCHLCTRPPDPIQQRLKVLYKGLFVLSILSQHALGSATLPATTTLPLEW